MSTLEADKQRIEELVELLNEESLRRAHKSVFLSFTNMLDYVDKVGQSKTSSDVTLLLGTYRNLAEKYYTQFELSLLEEIEEKGNLQNQLQPVVEQINEDDETKRLVRNALVARKALAIEEKNELIDQFPLLLQDSLDKLRDEWQRLDAIAVASQTAPDLVEVLNRIVKFAAYSVGIQDKRIIVVPGKEFALYFFSYLKKFAVLTVPIYSVQAPWDWSIFWHELAGYQVHDLENEETLIAIREKLVKIHDLYNKPDTKKDELLFILTNGITGASDYLKKVFETELDLKDFGSFEYQFECISLELTRLRKDRFTNYESMKKDGWSVDWIKELFEDAFSVLTFRYWFLRYFEDILGRHDKADDRHPPKKIRLAVAKELLRLAEFPVPEEYSEIKTEEPAPILTDQEKEDKEREEKIIKSAAEQIFNFVTLVLAASRITEEESVGNKNQIYMQRDFSPLQFREGLEAIEKWIEVHILEWSDSIDGMIQQVTPRNLSKKEQEYFLSEDVKNFIEKLRRDGVPVPNYEDLKNNYKQLLALSFIDVDYHSPGDIQLLESGLTYWVKPADWNSNAWSAQRKAHTPGNPVLLAHTIVTRVSDGSQWSVNKSDWNGWFKMTQ